MRGLAVLCLLAAAGVWGWALFWPKPLPPLPEDYVGVFMQTGFEPPIAGNGERVPMSNPYPPGQTRLFSLRADGTYTLSVTVSGDYEMMRQEGTIRYFEAGGILEMVQLSENRRKLEKPIPYRYHTRWGRDNQGRYLLLVKELDEAEKQRLKQGYEVYLRPHASKPGANRARD